MKKKYLTILAGAALIFVMLTGCGVGGAGQVPAQSSGNSSADREQELQAEIDALQQEIDTIKNSQQNSADSTDSTGTTDNTASGGTTADSGAAADSGTTTNSGTAADNGTTAGNFGQTSGNNNTASNSAGNQSGSGFSGNRTAADVAISLEQAQNIALERVPGATSQNISIKLDFDDGWYIYEGDILYNRMEYEFEIDANTGNVLKWEEERW